MVPPEPTIQDAQGEMTIVRMPAPVLGKVRSGSDDSWAGGFDPVAFDGDDEAICIHPPSDGVTVGILDRAVAQNARSVSATAYIANEQSEPIEFALAVVESGTESPGRLMSPADKAVAWSGWTRVIPGTRRRLTALLEDEGEQHSIDRRPLTLALITKMAEGHTNSFAWARIADVTVEYR
jgi:hypothetical protein